MQTNTNVGRRDVLKIGGGAVVAGNIGLAGCLGEDPGSTDNGDGNEQVDYPTRDITWVVPYSAGGGFDLLARAYSEMWPEYLPNDVNIVVQNRTGGGGLTGATFVSRSDPDGYTIGWWNIPGFTVSQIRGDTTFDLRDISWMARIAEYRFSFVVAPNSEFKTPEDLINADRPIKIGSTGKASTGYVFAEILSKRMEFEVEHVTGYNGAAETRFAVQRGDIDTYISNAVHALPMVNDNNLRYLFMISPEPLEVAPDVPTVVDMGFEDAYKNIAIHFIVGGPPGIDEDVLDVIDKSLRETTESSEFMEWAEEADQAVAIDYADRHETAEIVSDGLDTYKQFEDIFT